VKPKDSKDGNEEGGHQNEGPVKDRLSFWIIVGRVSNPLHEVGIGPCVALATGLYEPLLRDQGLWIITRQNAVEPVAVCAPRHQFRVAQMLDLPMIAFIIGLRGDEENFVSLHHLFICMTFLANFCMELLPKCHGLWLIAFQDRNFMEAVTITAIRGIWISFHGSFSVDALCITIIGVTRGAFLNDSYLIPFPWGHLVNVFMTVFTLNIINKMYTGIMFGPFPLMTSMTGNWLGINLCALCLHMRFDICDIPVATVAGVGPMNRLGKLPFTDFFMATQTFGIVNTFITIFPTLDDEFFSLFPRFRKFGRLCGFDTLFFRSGFCCPQHP
jgi:hypothetical protein